MGLVSSKIIKQAANLSTFARDMMFGRTGPVMLDGPIDLRDKMGDECLASNSTPLVSRLKTSGPNCEIGFGSASLSDLVLMFLHPLLTLIAQILIVASVIGPIGFVLIQIVYAILMIPIFGRAWQYYMRTTVATTIGCFGVQVAAASWMPDFASVVVAVTSAIMIGRPFVESALSTRDALSVTFPLPKGFEPPRQEKDFAIHQQQLDNAKADSSPLYKLAQATGRFKDRGDPHAPDRGQMMAISKKDLNTHLFLFGKTAKGKTTSVMMPLALQWLLLASPYDHPIHGKILRNGGGMLIMDGKNGQLPRDVFARLQAMNLFGSSEKPGVIESIFVSTDVSLGGVPVAPLEGLSGDEAALAYHDASGMGEDKVKTDFFDLSGQVILSHALTLLKACVELELAEQTSKAKAFGFATREAWIESLDESARARGYDDHEHEAESYAHARRNLPANLAPAIRRFRWNHAHADNMLQWLLDSRFTMGEEPAEGAVDFSAPIVPGGILNWLRDHPDVRARTNKGERIGVALRYMREDWTRMRSDLRSDLVQTATAWTSPLSLSVELTGWAKLEHGADPTRVTKGAVVGVDLSRHGKAGMIITSMIQQRIKQAIMNRPDAGDWSSKGLHDERDVQILVDECHSILVPGNDSILRKFVLEGRSKGAYIVLATQTINELFERLGKDFVLSILGNMGARLSLDSTPETLNWINESMKQQRLVRWPFRLSDSLRDHLTKRPHGALPVDYLRAVPAAVLLTASDIEKLGNEEDRSGTHLSNVMHLALLPLAGVKEATIGTLRIVSAALRRLLQLRHLINGTGYQSEVLDYEVPPYKQVVDKNNPDGHEWLFDEDQHQQLHEPHTMIVAVTRGGAPRRDICRAIKPMSVQDIQTWAREQGCYTLLDGIAA